MREQCRKAKVPEPKRLFHTKPELALESLRHATELGVDFGWGGFDAFYGGTPRLLRDAVSDDPRCWLPSSP
jgi:SRSO17 transposase